MLFFLSFFLSPCIHTYTVTNIFHTDEKPFKEGNVFYLMTHSTHFIYGYMASDIWLMAILIVRKETCCHHYLKLTARVLLYAPSLRQESTYHSLCYTSCVALAGTINSSMGPPHKGSIRRPIAPWANALTMELHLAPFTDVIYQWYNCLLIDYRYGWMDKKDRCMFVTL